MGVDGAVKLDGRVVESYAELVGQLLLLRSHLPDGVMPAIIPTRFAIAHVRSHQRGGSEELDSIPTTNFSLANQVPTSPFWTIVSGRPALLRHGRLASPFQKCVEFYRPDR